MILRNAASQRQVEAADPANSTWVSANAGSGKTRVLTDRVSRLLLDGVAPQNILCLTYTKAAASEMQTRLFRRLGAWAMQDDATLRDELVELGVEGDLGTPRLREARRLFAQALEVPGGLKIQTIHAFCAGLLRRFPREAGVSPQFRELEERAAVLLRAEVVDAMAMGPDLPVVDALLRHVTSDDLDKILTAILRDRDAFDTVPTRADLLSMHGLQSDAVHADALELAFQGHESGIVSDLIAAFASTSKTYTDFTATLARVDLDSPDQAGLETLYGLFLHQSGEFSGQSRASRFPQSNHKAAVAAMAPFADAVFDWMDRTEAARQHLLALDAVDRTRALYAFATAFLRGYDTQKLWRGALDFDDLIRNARALLTDPQVAQWVLFRLDGGIDHILVDEAQDTSPGQWAVIRSLTQEFAAGRGARPDQRRTIFVVGDQKQSIYSFQGADPEAFDQMRRYFDAELAVTGQGLNALELEYSFRSSHAVLRTVDHVFRGPHLAGLGASPPHHMAFREAMPGRVDLWPPVATVKDDAEGRHWTDPVDQVGQRHHAVQLAQTIARAIAEMVKTGTIPARNGDGSYGQRPVTEGDILILVQRRSELFSELIRALKSAGLRVAGADRLRVGAELAVRDIAALLRFLSLPEDDLSLACALRSPLFGWSEQELYTLAQPRPEKTYLWETLRNAAGHPDTLAVLDDLRREADYLRPYDLINRILTRHDGRRRLIARLGTEAEEGIDALLSQAMAYESANVPGLTGFLEWMETDSLEVKRQADSAGDAIRVMTVHGAKGLESPIVILPDTAKRKPSPSPILYPSGKGVIWATPVAEMPPLMQEKRAETTAKQADERRRLLYVAMTRAESWLIVCAAGETGEGGDSWHAMVTEGLELAGAEQVEMPTGPGLRFSHLDWDALPHVETPVIAKTVTVPAQLDPLPIVLAARDSPLSPSDLGGAKVMPGEAEADERDAALSRGSLIHLLLEHLPAIAAADRANYASALVTALPDANLVPDHAGLIADVLRLIDAPALAPIFAGNGLSEVSLTAHLPELGNRAVQGAIDRLVITPSAITAIDFKSNRIIPTGPEQVPEGILRQMGAYCAMLQQIYPDKQISSAILWTAEARLMPLPPALVMAALQRATIP